MFIDPVAQVVIKNPTTKQEWEFTPRNRPTTGGRISLPFMTALSITFKMDGFGPIVMTIDAPYEDGKRLMMQPPSPFAVDNVITARIGYSSGEYTEWATGLLSAGGEGLSIDANGISGSVVFAGVARSAFYTMPKNVRVIKDYEGLLATIAKYMGCKLKISPDAAEQIKKMNSIPVENSSIIGSTVREVLGLVIARLGLVCDFGPLPGLSSSTKWLHIRKPTEQVNSNVAIDAINTYVMRGGINVPMRQYPLLAWAPEGVEYASWLAEHPNAAASGAASYIVDTDSGQIAALKVLPAELQEKLVGVLAETPPAEEELDGEDVNSDNSRGEEDFAEILSLPSKPGAAGLELARTEIEAEVMNGNSGQRGTINTVGVPGERPGNTCNVRGLTPIYDSKYMIEKVTYSWSLGTFDMSLGVYRFGKAEKASGAQEETQGGQL